MLLYFCALSLISVINTLEHDCTRCNETISENHNHSGFLNDSVRAESSPHNVKEKAVEFRQVLELLGKNSDRLNITVNKYLNRTKANNKSKENLEVQLQKPSALKNETDRFEKIEKFTDFKPSTPVEPYYEFNKFPVIPAFPEAKFPGHTALNIEEYHFEDRPRLEKPPIFKSQPWINRIKFPAPNVQTSRDRPYDFYPIAPSSPSTSPGKPSESSEEKKIITSYEKNPSSPQFNVFSKSPPPNVPSFWDKFRKTFYDKDPIEKDHYDSSVILDKPPYELQFQDHSLTENKFQNGNPWKKIIKILTAIIPIGLLISALTPTVITVTPMNGTQLRSRAEDSYKNSKLLLSSLNHFSTLNLDGCEDKILCELLLSAANTKDGENHVENILNNLNEHKNYVLDKREDLRRVFNAVRNQNCDSIRCKRFSKS